MVTTKGRLLAPFAWRINFPGGQLAPLQSPDDRYGALFVKALLRGVGITCAWFTLALLTLWAAAALYVDFRIAALRVPVTVIYVLGIIAILVKLEPKRWAAAWCFAGFCG